MTTIYKDEIAKKVCDLILSECNDGKFDTPIEGYELRSVGYWKDGNKWIAYDNTTCDCWIEEFDNEKDASEYCNV